VTIHLQTIWTITRYRWIVRA